MQEVLDGCKVCGKRMLTNRSPLVHRTCDACKAEQRREANRKLAERRKAERHAAKATMGVPLCQQCGEPIEGANRLTAPYETRPWKSASRNRPQWARKFCSNRCRQAAFQARSG